MACSPNQLLMTIVFIFFMGFALTGSAEQRASSEAEMSVEVFPSFGCGGPRRCAIISAGEMLYFNILFKDLGSDNGKVDCSYICQMVDFQGNTVGELEEKRISGCPGLGGTSEFAICGFQTDLNTPPGIYQTKVLVHDFVHNHNKVVSFPIKILPSDEFNATNLKFSHGEDGYATCGNCFTIGDNLYLNFAIVGFAVADSKMKVKLRETVEDEQGNSIDASPFEKLINNVIDDQTRIEGLKYHTTFRLNRAGKYTLNLHLTDEISNKAVSNKIPFQVLEWNPLNYFSPVQNSNKISCISTYGQLGSPRLAEYLPDETMFTTISVNSLRNKGGDIAYRSTMDLYDPSNIYITTFDNTQKTKPYQGNFSIVNGMKMPIPGDSSKGEYHFKIQVKDLADNSGSDLDYSFKVIPASQISAKNIELFHGEKQDRPAGAHLHLGDTVTLKFSAVRMMSKDNHINATASLTILDEYKNQVRNEISVKSIGKENQAIDITSIYLGMPIEFQVHLSRPGNFFLRLKLTDHMADKEKSYDIPIVVM
jgi:hypothetical protein